MWESVVDYLLSSIEFKSLAIGALLGAILSVWGSIRSKKPKLLINGAGSAGNNKKKTYNLSFTNTPSFFGVSFEGESARNVHAYIKPDTYKPTAYRLYWNSETPPFATIAPGDQPSLTLFMTREGDDKYNIIDHQGEPVANFGSREKYFIVTLHDILDRKTSFRILVEYDNTHLKREPRFRIVPPLTFKARLYDIKSGVGRIVYAFRAK